MKKALVTGANGFVGSALVRELVKNNVEVIALDRDGCNNNIPKNVRFVAHELSESSKLADIIPDRDILSLCMGRLGRPCESRHRFTAQ